MYFWGNQNFHGNDKHRTSKLVNLEFCVNRICYKRANIDILKDCEKENQQNVYDVITTLRHILVLFWRNFIKIVFTCRWIYYYYGKPTVGNVVAIYLKSNIQKCFILVHSTCHRPLFKILVIAFFIANPDRSKFKVYQYSIPNLINLFLTGVIFTLIRLREDW